MTLRQLGSEFRLQSIRRGEAAGRAQRVRFGVEGGGQWRGVAPRGTSGTSRSGPPLASVMGRARGGPERLPPVESGDDLCGVTRIGWFDDELLPVACFFALGGGLIQTAPGFSGAAGGLDTKRSGWTAKAASSTAWRAVVMASA